MSRISDAVHTRALQYARLSERRPWLLLGIYLLISIGCVVVTRYFMEIRTDLESLLPQGSPSVVALEQSRARTGSTDQYVIAATSPDPAANVQFIKDATAELKTWKETQSVQIDRDPSFFADHALLYLPKQDLEKLRDKLAEEIKWQKKLINPMFVDLRTEEEKVADDHERRKKCSWLDSTLSRRLGLDDDTFNNIVEADALGLVECEAEGAEAVVAAPPEPAAEEPEEPDDPPAVAALAPVPIPKELKHYLLSPNGQVAVLMASMSEPATDVVKSRELMERGELVLAKLDPKKYHPDMRVSVGGAYQNFKEVESISHDSTIATLASVIFVLVILLSFFRNLRSLLLLVIPLSMGIVWSIGLTTVTFGHLNISTLFVFSMLVGMGIDFGIHLYSRILEEYRKGVPMVESVATASVTSGRAMVSAAGTTIASLMTLLMAHFVGFIEFGIIASYGIALCLAAAFLIMPPAIFALEKLRVTPRPDTVDEGPLPQSSLETLRKLRVGTMIMLVVGLGVAGLAAANWEKASFEHDFRNLRGPSTDTGIAYGSAVGRNRSSSGALILGKDVAQMREVHKALSDRLLANEPDSYLASYITIETYVPPAQAERMEVIQEIQELVADRKLDRTKGEARQLIERMRVLSATQPFTVDEVPLWAKRAITEQDGSVGAIGVLYSTHKKWDAADVQRFQDQLGVIKVSSGDVLVASSGFILSDVIRTVKHDAATLVPWVFAALILVLLIDLRSLKATLLCVTSMAVALLFAIGGMVLFDIKLGLYNMIVLPMVLGTGIDGSIHIYHRYRELGTRRLLHVLKTTGLSVAASSMTTLGGFLGLLFVAHMGVNTIGTLAVAGISATLLAIFMVLPGLLLLFYPNEPGEVEAPPADGEQTGA